MTVKRPFNIVICALIILIFTFSFSVFNACKNETVQEEETESTVKTDEETETADETGEVIKGADETEEATGYIDITAYHAKELIDSNPDLIIIDVSPVYDEGHIPGAVNYYIGDGSLDTAIPDLDPDGTYLVYCHTDSASMAGAEKLIDTGFTDVYRLEGNFAAWVSEGYEIETTGGDQMGLMSITSPAFDNNGDIPEKYTCDGENINPELIFGGVPPYAISLVLIVDDPDAPSGTWVHWTIWNISPGVTSIAENSIPAGSVEGKTDSGTPGYGGPCPPSGTHRYFFKLYALDETLDLDTSASASDITDAMGNHVLDSAELIGLYSR